MEHNQLGGAAADQLAEGMAISTEAPQPFPPLPGEATEAGPWQVVAGGGSQPAPRGAG